MLAVCQTTRQAFEARPSPKLLIYVYDYDDFICMLELEQMSCVDISGDEEELNDDASYDVAAEDEGQEFTRRRP